MYSIVLLAALASGETTPDCFRCGGLSCGCHGFGSFGSCYGSCYGVCYGGYACGGGYGCGGCWGMSYGGYAPGWGCCGGCGGYYSPAYGVPAPMMAPMGEPLKSGGKVISGMESEQVSAAKRAKLIVKMPDDAKLYVDGKPISVSAQKTFRTPELKKGQAYYYEFRAEVVRDGKPISETRRVIVKAGAVIRADFSSLGNVTGVASAKTREFSFSRVSQKRVRVAFLRNAAKRGLPPPPPSAAHCRDISARRQYTRYNRRAAQARQHPGHAQAIGRTDRHAIAAAGAERFIDPGQFDHLPLPSASSRPPAMHREGAGVPGPSRLPGPSLTQPATDDWNQRRERSAFRATPAGFFAARRTHVRGAGPV